MLTKVAHLAEIGTWSLAPWPCWPLTWPAGPSATPLSPSSSRILLSLLHFCSKARSPDRSGVAVTSQGGSQAHRGTSAFPPLWRPPPPTIFLSLTTCFWA